MHRSCVRIGKGRGAAGDSSPFQMERTRGGVGSTYGAFPLHGTVRFGTARYGTVRLSSGRFAFPPQFSTAIEWAGLFTHRYNCAASTCRDIIVNAPQTNSQQRKETE